MLKRFESFEPRQLDARRETPLGKKAEQERKEREERYAYFTFKDSAPELMLELAQRLLLDVSNIHKIDEDEWSLEYDDNVFISFSVLKDAMGFMITDKTGNIFYTGEFIDEAEDAINNVLDQVSNEEENDIDECLQKFEAFKSSRVDTRKETPQGKKAEKERKKKEAELENFIFKYKEFSLMLESLKLEDETNFASYMKDNVNSALDSIVNEMLRNIEIKMAEYGFEIVFSNLQRATKEVYGGFFFKTETNKYFLRIEGIRDIELYAVTKLKDKDIISDFNVVYSYMLKHPYAKNDKITKHRDFIFNLGKINSLLKLRNAVRTFENTLAK